MRKNFKVQLCMQSQGNCPFTTVSDLPKVLTGSNQPPVLPVLFFCVLLHMSCANTGANYLFPTQDKDHISKYEYQRTVMI